MRDFLDFIGDHTELFYTGLAGVFGFFSAYLRSAIQDPDKSKRVRISEALLCSMFSSALVQLGYVYFAMPLDLAMPVGVFAGYMGAPAIVNLAIRFLRKKAGIAVGEGK